VQMNEEQEVQIRRVNEINLQVRAENERLKAMVVEEDRQIEVKDFQVFNL
jgi:hypothetical protein